MIVNKNEIDLFLELAKIHSITDVINKLPTFMCHIGQERDVFGTHREENIPSNKSKKAYLEKKIEKLGPEKYIHHFVFGEGIDKEFIAFDNRIACSCKQMAEVSAKLICRIKKCEVYIIGQSLPSYIRGLSSNLKYEHYFNATIENEKIRFFDSAVYKHVFDMENNRWVNPDLLFFNRANINYDKFIKWDRFLQKSFDRNSSNNRRIELHKGNKLSLSDNFSNKKLKNHYYFKVEYP